MLKKHIVKLVELSTPRLLDAYRAIKTRRSYKRRFALLHQRAFDELYNGADIRVLTGPFEGLKYINEIVWGPITPKWLGSYECELHPALREIISTPYKVIVDVGCAEGYYAVGLVSRIPTATMFAFDTDFISRRQVGRLARINNLQHRIKVSSYCTHEDLGRLRTSRALLICDIEGFERLLLDPQACPSLGGYDILVEVHEGFAGVATKELLIKRFTDSHCIKQFHPESRRTWIESVGKKRFTAVQTLELIQEATNEHRSASQLWLWMTAMTEINDNCSESRTASRPYLT